MKDFLKKAKATASGALDKAGELAGDVKEKAGELASDVKESVSDSVEGFKGSTFFVAESFKTLDDVAEAANSLQETYKDVDVQSLVITEMVDPYSVIFKVSK